MPDVLTPAQIDAFHRDGCIFPIRVLPEAEALEIRRRLEVVEAESGGPLGGHLRHKTHLLFSGLGDLVRDSRIVDAIADLYGDDLLCWTTNFHQTSVSQVEDEDSATLVRGVDRFGHFEAEPWPLSDMDPAFVAPHERITARNAKILYRGTGVTGYNDPRALPERAA